MAPGASRHSSDSNPHIVKVRPTSVKIHENSVKVQANSVKVQANSVKVHPNSVNVHEDLVEVKATLAAVDKKCNDCQRIVIIGAGPTGLGAAYRFFERANSTTEVIILEMEQQAGGLASSYRDDKGFLWDNGGHVVFSHYDYFNVLLKKAVRDWNKRSRASYAYMMGSSGKRKFIPYPVQHNIHIMDKEEQQVSVRGLEEISAHPSLSKPHNFDEWLVKNFGEGLSEVFMRKYNRKVWTVDPREMNSDWVGERVAVPDVDVIKSKIAQWNSNNTNGHKAKDSNWGPNQMFDFPAFGGTGQIWKSVSQLIPQDWFRFGHIATSINSEKKVLDIITTQGHAYSMTYDYLISTAPLDYLLNMVEDIDPKLPKLGAKFVYSHTHVIGIGLEGQPPPFLANKSWIYFPDSDSPFYRITVFSNYADDNVPSAGKVWSLMCEAAEQKHAEDLSKWEEPFIIKQTIDALVNYGFIDSSQVLSTYHRRLEHGYPVPFLEREQYLSSIQPWLQSRSIFSRGRFGGWRYEVSNQDHSLMQGVEVADYIMFRTPEETYPNASLVNSMKASDRRICHPPDYEIAVAHYNEDLSWLAPYADHCHVYHKGGDKWKPKQKFKQWEILPNVGRESHTYLYHIITNYHCLADVTLFAQGEVKKHLRWAGNKTLEKFIKVAKEKGFYASGVFHSMNWGKIHYAGKWVKLIRDGKVALGNMTLGQFWEVLYGYPHPKEYLSHFNAIFSASRASIISKPLSFYKKAISYVDHHPNPEEGHYFERLWAAIFSSNT